MKFPITFLETKGEWSEFSEDRTQGLKADVNRANQNELNTAAVMETWKVICPHPFSKSKYLQKGSLANTGQYWNVGIAVWTINYTNERQWSH